ncbi:multidrug effflux MFS transporter [Nocardioides sp. CER19]|uniref:multidrug effflux MFS transporter n=1 Tax=Nocardioides sp. CER19 TaxID=3038538 RepID=UPI00244D45ED|nr:multidrug effflux MFS transporter [Nocardioides sp. CER19]MDH2413000.1 multidrug effflux MFS transporter [Nocardioides sp. CER19]
MIPSPTASATAERTLPGRTLLLLGALTAVAPLVTDLYLPALPQLGDAWGADDATTQLTMSVCLIGLALGQLVAGPLSDRVGRLRPLRWGIGVLAVTSFLCALAPDVGTLIVLRAIQGLAGSAGVVIARAIVRDVYEGERAARVFSELMLVTGLAPVLGPVLGGQLLRVTDWRGIFVVLALLSTLLLVAVLTRLPETRTGVAQVGGSDLRLLLRDRRFTRYLGMSAAFGVVLFAYISMSSFVLQDGYGVSASAYSLVFGANAVGMILGSQVSARLVGRTGAASMLIAAVGLIVCSTAAVAAAGVLGAPLAVVLVPLWLVLVGLGAALGNTVALALLPHRERAGAASALIGTAQFLFGAAIPPLASLGGASAGRMGVTMLAASVVALGCQVAACAGRRD